MFEDILGEQVIEKVEEEPEMDIVNCTVNHQHSMLSVLELFKLPEGSKFRMDFKPDRSKQVYWKVSAMQHSIDTSDLYTITWREMSVPGHEVVEATCDRTGRIVMIFIMGISDLQNNVYDSGEGLVRLYKE